MIFVNFCRLGSESTSFNTVQERQKQNNCENNDYVSTNIINDNDYSNKRNRSDDKKAHQPRPRPAFPPPPSLKVMRHSVLKPTAVLVYRRDRDYDKIGPSPGGTSKSRIAALPILPEGLHRAPSSSTPITSRGAGVMPDISSPLSSRKRQSTTNKLSNHYFNSTNDAASGKNCDDGSSNYMITALPVHTENAEIMERGGEWGDSQSSFSSDNLGIDGSRNSKYSIFPESGNSHSSNNDGYHQPHQQQKQHNFSELQSREGECWNGNPWEINQHTSIPNMVSTILLISKIYISCMWIAVYCIFLHICVSLNL